MQQVWINDWWTRGDRCNDIVPTCWACGFADVGLTNLNSKCMSLWFQWFCSDHFDMIMLIDHVTLLHPCQYGIVVIWLAFLIVSAPALLALIWLVICLLLCCVTFTFTSFLRKFHVVTSFYFLFRWPSQWLTKSVTPSYPDVTGLIMKARSENFDVVFNCSSGRGPHTLCPKAWQICVSLRWFETMFQENRNWLLDHMNIFIMLD